MRHDQKPLDNLLLVTVIDLKPLSVDATVKNMTQSRKTGVIPLVSSSEFPNALTSQVPPLTNQTGRGTSNFSHRLISVCEKTLRNDGLRETDEKASLPSLLEKETVNQIFQ